MGWRSPANGDVRPSQDPCTVADTLAEEVADLRLTPEKLAFWTTRLESAAKLRREVEWVTPVKPPRSKLPSPGGESSSGEENWHTPHTTNRPFGSSREGLAGRRPQTDASKGDAAAATPECAPSFIKALHEC